MADLEQEVLNLRTEKENIENKLVESEAKVDELTKEITRLNGSAAPGLLLEEDVLGVFFSKPEWDSERVITTVATWRRDSMTIRDKKPPKENTKAKKKTDKNGAKDVSAVDPRKQLKITESLSDAPYVICIPCALAGKNVSECMCITVQGFYQHRKSPDCVNQDLGSVLEVEKHKKFCRKVTYSGKDSVNGEDYMYIRIPGFHETVTFTQFGPPTAEEVLEEGFIHPGWDFRLWKDFTSSRYFVPNFRDFVLFHMIDTTCRVLASGTSSTPVAWPTFQNMKDTIYLEKKGLLEPIKTRVASEDITATHIAVFQRHRELLRNTVKTAGAHHVTDRELGRSKPNKKGRAEVDSDADENDDGDDYDSDREETDNGSEVEDDEVDENNTDEEQYASCNEQQGSSGDEDEQEDDDEEEEEEEMGTPPQINHAAALQVPKGPSKVGRAKKAPKQKAPKQKAPKKKAAKTVVSKRGRK